MFCHKPFVISSSIFSALWIIPKCPQIAESIIACCLVQYGSLSFQVLCISPGFRQQFSWTTYFFIYFHVGILSMWVYFCVPETIKKPILFQIFKFFTNSGIFELVFLGKPWVLKHGGRNCLFSAKAQPWRKIYSEPFFKIFLKDDLFLCIFCIFWGFRSGFSGVWHLLAKFQIFRWRGVFFSEGCVNSSVRTNACI